MRKIFLISKEILFYNILPYTKSFQPCSFSKLNFILHYLRTIMSQSKKSNITFLSIERDMFNAIDFDAVKNRPNSSYHARCKSRLHLCLYSKDVTWIKNRNKIGNLDCVLKKGERKVA